MSRWRDYLRGFCSAFDGAATSLFPTRLDDYPHKNEAEAIRADWETVGDNMKTVMDELERTIGNYKP